jgi:hypothetical protein
MAQMNKRVKIDNRRAELERELIDDQNVHEDEINTGKVKIDEKNRFQRNAQRDVRLFRIKQGIRKRHPDRVLHQFNGVKNTTSTASTLWEQALIHDTKRTELPQDFRPKGDIDMMTNQMGIVTTALDNYKSSRGKLERMHLVGV